MRLGKSREREIIRKDGKGDHYERWKGRYLGKMEREIFRKDGKGDH